MWLCGRESLALIMVRANDDGDLARCFLPESSHCGAKFLSIVIVGLAGLLYGQARWISERQLQIMVVC